MFVNFETNTLCKKQMDQYNTTINAKMAVSTYQKQECFMSSLVKNIVSL